MCESVFFMKTQRFFRVILVVLCCLFAHGWQAKQPDVIFVPTPNRVAEEMLRMADIHSDDLIYDLGCGDGRIVIFRPRVHRKVGFGDGYGTADTPGFKGMKGGSDHFCTHESGCFQHTLFDE